MAQHGDAEEEFGGCRAGEGLRQRELLEVDLGREPFELDDEAVVQDLEVRWRAAEGGEAEVVGVAEGGEEGGEEFGALDAGGGRGEGCGGHCCCCCGKVELRDRLSWRAVGKVGLTDGYLSSYFFSCTIVRPVILKLEEEDLPSYTAALLSPSVIKKSLNIPAMSCVKPMLADEAVPSHGDVVTGAS